MTRVLFIFVASASYRGLNPFIHCVNAVVVYLAHYCGSVLNIYCITIVVCLEMVWGVYLAYDRDFGWLEAIMCTMYAIITFLFMALAGAVFEHISKLYMKLDFVNEENIKLLNGMHEGVLIMSKPIILGGKRELMFGNKSAFKVFTKSMEDKEIIY